MSSGPSHIVSFASSSVAGTVRPRESRWCGSPDSIQRRNLEYARLTELQEAWERRDFATTWKLTRILTGKRIGPKKRRLVAPQAASFNKKEWLAHLARPGSQGDTQGAQQTRVIEHVFEDVWHEHLFAKLLQRVVFFLVRYGDYWLIQTLCEADSVTALALNNVRHVHLFLMWFFKHWFGTWLFHEKLREVGTCLKVSHCQTTMARQAFLDCCRYTTLDTGGKTYYSQLWKLVTHSWKRDYATGYCHRRRREQAIAQHGVLLERAAKENLTATLYDLTNAFACGAQESQAGDPASLADVVRGEVQNLTAREHFCQRLAGGQLRLQCVDGQLAAKIGSGTLPGDMVAGGWFLLHFHPKLDAFFSATPELQIKVTSPFAIPNAPEVLDVGTSTFADDIIRETPGPLQRTLSQESIAPATLSTMLWHHTLFKIAANKRSFPISPVAGHTQRFFVKCTSHS